MPSDLEARIIRLEQLIPVVSRRLVKVRAVNGQNLQNFTLIRDSIGDGNTNPAVITDPTCGVTIYTLMQLTDSQYGVWSLVWLARGAGLVEPQPPAGETSPVIASASGAWQGCRTVVVGGVTTPIMYTVFSPWAGQPTAYTCYGDWINDGTGHAASGTCASSFNASLLAAPQTRAIPTCGPPWQVQFGATMPIHTGVITLTFAAP